MSFNGITGQLSSWWCHLHTAHPLRSCQHFFSVENADHHRRKWLDLSSVWNCEGAAVWRLQSLTGFPVAHFFCWLLTGDSFLLKLSMIVFVYGIGKLVCCWACNLRIVRVDRASKCLELGLSSYLHALPKVSESFDRQAYMWWEHGAMAIVSTEVLCICLTICGWSDLVCRGREAMLAVTAGLSCLHAQGVAHLDLKTPNLLITSDRKIKIADFGLGKLVDGPTNTATQMGSFIWMAPEHALHGTCGLASDLWSLSCIFWEVSQSYSSVACSIKEGEHARE